MIFASLEVAMAWLMEADMHLDRKAGTKRAKKMNALINPANVKAAKSAISTAECVSSIVRTGKNSC